MTDSDHAARVADYYDSNTREFYLRYWDDVDIHFGLFDQVTAYASIRDATRRMTSMLTEPGAISRDDHVVDAGCGVGGAAIDISVERGCRVTGLTISPVQVEIASANAVRAGVADRVRFMQCDCSERLPFDDRSVDVIVTIEAACHFTDRDFFVRECARVLRTHGRIVGSDWMVSDGVERGRYRSMIEPVCDAWHLAGLDTPRCWRDRLESSGFEVHACDDLGQAVLENARILERAYLDLTLEEANGCHPATRAASWKRQYSTLIRAWIERCFTIGRFHATVAGRCGARAGS